MSISTNYRIFVVSISLQIYEEVVH